MRKLMVFGLIWLLFFTLALFLIESQLNPSEPLHPSDGGTQEQDTDEPPYSGFVTLKVNGYMVDDFWDRGPSDMPVLAVAVDYVVENVGNGSANIVTVEISLNSVHFYTETVNNLLPDTAFTDSVSFSVDYDQSKTVRVEAFCGNITGFWSYTVEAKLPRHPLWSVSKLFVTPNDEPVKSAYEEIMGSAVLVHWVAIRDWVGRNIEYVSDYDSHGVSEFWQLGRETLESRRGDSEDFAILLCSLLRADGWSAEGVYVVIGQNEAGEYHAWVKIKIPLVGWYNIDPQLDGWNTLIGDFIALHGYTAIYSFNDQHFIEL